MERAKYFRAICISFSVKRFLSGICVPKEVTWTMTSNRDAGDYF